MEITKVGQPSPIRSELSRKLNDTESIKMSIMQRNEKIIRLNLEISDLEIEDQTAEVAAVIEDKKQIIANLKVQNERDEESLLSIEAEAQEL